MKLAKGLRPKSVFRYTLFLMVRAYKLKFLLRQCLHTEVLAEIRYIIYGFLLSDVSQPILLSDISQPIFRERIDEWDRRGKAIREAWGQFAREGTLPEALDGTAIRKLV